jgi:hypothetical protein
VTTNIEIVVYGLRNSPAHMSCSCDDGCNCGGTCDPLLTQEEEFIQLKEYLGEKRMAGDVSLEFRDLFEIDLSAYPELRDLIKKDRTLMPVTEIDGRICFYAGINKGQILKYLERKYGIQSGKES